MRSKLLLLLCLPSLLFAEVKPASPFATHMVLQCGMKVPVWGTADAGEKVTVEFAEQSKSAVAGVDGRWRIDLDPLAVSSESRAFKIKGSLTKEALLLEDVLVGEVWLCGGQSNMERQLGLRDGQKPIVNWEQEVAAANYPTIRQLYITQHSAVTPQATTPAAWTVCSPATVGNFTAVGYFFARDLQKARSVPIGIIHSSIGGTPAEAWTSEEGLRAFPDFVEGIAAAKMAAVDAKAAKQAYREQLDRWFQDFEPGSGKQAWSASVLDTTGWETMTLPVMWENAGHPGFDGVAWFRKDFDLPTDWKGGDIELRLSAIDDKDTTWVNGVQVGATDLWNTPRVYRVPGSLLKAKGNVIAVRVLDTGGNGGIWNPDTPFELVSLDRSFASIPLAGPWLCRFSVNAYATARRLPVDVIQSNSAPAALFNAMIAPLIPYALRGAIFYQGESNAERPAQYRKLLPSMIADWRNRWGEGDFPFLFVQIAPFKDQPPEIREAQLLAWQETKNTAMAVTIDHGDANDIHPVEKQPVGARLSLAARALAYGEAIEYSGPVYEKMTIDANRVILSFSHLGGGLLAKGGPLTGFTIAGSEGKFVPAQAEIVGDTVVVSSPEISNPVTVRYGWANVASGNLFNKADLPASPFRTDVAVGVTR